ncbi:MAG: hypothetical protein WA728_32300 [Xanthobacteraceae bacterium]
MDRETRAGERWNEAGLASVFLMARADWLSGIAGCHFDLRLDEWLPPGRIKKPLLDFRRNLLQPFLGTISPILIVSDIRLEIIYLVVGCPKLIVSSSKLFVSCS